MALGGNHHIGMDHSTEDIDDDLCECVHKEDIDELKDNSHLSNLLRFKSHSEDDRDARFFADI